MSNEGLIDGGILAETDDLSIQSLLWEAQLGFIAHNYTSAISFLEQALGLGSPSAAASLANVYVRGMKHDGQIVLDSDLELAMEYFQHGLALIKSGGGEIESATDDQDDNDSYDGGEEPQASPTKHSKIYFRPMNNDEEDQEEDDDENSNIAVSHDIVIGIAQLFIYDKVKKSQANLWDTCADILRSYTSYAQPEAGKFAASIRIHASFALGMAEIHMLKRKEGDERQCNVRARAHFTSCTEIGFCGVREADMLITKALSRLKKLSTQAVRVPSSDTSRASGPTSPSDPATASPDDTSPPQSIDSATGSGSGSGSGSSHLAALRNPSEVHVVGVPQISRPTTNPPTVDIGLEGCHFCHKQGYELPLCSCRKVRYCSFGCKLKDVETSGHACLNAQKVCSD